MFRRRHQLTLFAAAWALSACAAGLGTSSNGDTRRPSRSGDVLGLDEIQERAPGARFALDAIRQLRNDWVRGVLGTRSFQETATMRVYLDNISIAQGPEWLRSFPVDRLIELRYYRPSDATQRWGTGHALGAIEVVTVGRRTLGDPEPGAPDDGTSPVTSVSLHRTDFVWTAHANTAVMASPRELSFVWQPDVSAGVAVGLTARPNVTVSVGLDLHRFRFSETGALDYLATRGRGRLTTRAGARIAGEPTTSFNASMRVRLHPRPRRVRPYLVGSAGYGRMTVGAFSVTANDGGPLPAQQFPMGIAAGGNQIENTFTFGLGGGMEAALTTRVKAFADFTYLYTVRGPRYEDVFGAFQLFNTSFFPLRVGLSY